MDRQAMAQGFRGWLMGGQHQEMPAMPVAQRANRIASQGKSLSISVGYAGSTRVQDSEALPIAYWIIARGRRFGFQLIVHQDNDHLIMGGQAGKRLFSLARRAAKIAQEKDQTAGANDAG